MVDVVASMARHASKHVSYSSRRPRAASFAYSPDVNWCPDITLIHGAHDGSGSGHHKEMAKALTISQ